MEVTDRSLFEAFSADERTLPLRKLRSTLESRFDENLQLIHQLASGEESLNFESIVVAKNSLLRAFQIRYAIRVGCDKIKGHEQVVAKIQMNLDDKLRKSVIYMNEVNQWVSMIDGAGATAVPSA
jgi:hypothetical protein